MAFPCLSADIDAAVTADIDAEHRFATEAIADAEVGMHLAADWSA